MSWHWKVHVLMAAIIVSLVLLLTHTWGRIESLKEMVIQTHEWTLEVNRMSTAMLALAEAKNRDSQVAAEIAAEVWQDICKLPSRALQKALVRWAQVQERKEEREMTVGKPPLGQSSSIGGPD